MTEAVIAEIGEQPVVMTVHAFNQMRSRMLGRKGRRVSNLPLPHRTQAWLNFAQSLLCNSQEALAERHQEREKNNGQPALYYYNRRYGVRFVLVQEQDCFRIVTVEEPFEQIWTN